MCFSLLLVCEFCYFPLESTTCGLSSPPKPVLGQPRPTHLDSTGAAGAPLGCASRPQDLGLPPRGGGDPGRRGPLGRRWPGVADFESGWRVGSGEVGKLGSGEVGWGRFLLSAFGLRRHFRIKHMSSSSCFFLMEIHWSIPQEGSYCNGSGKTGASSSRLAGRWLRGPQVVPGTSKQVSELPGP